MSPLVLPPLPDLAVMSENIRNAQTHHVTGRVAAISGATVVVEGMSAPVGAVCEIRTASMTTIARIVGFNGVKPILAPLTECKSLAAGDPVVLTSPSLRVGIGPMMLGRVLDALGRPIDGRPLPKGLSHVDVDRSAPASLERPPIDQPLATGVKAIDALLTLGQGQRIGIFAGTGVGKSTLLGMLARGTAADAIVIAMVGERGREVRDFIERTLGEEGVRRSVLVVATSDQPASLRIQASWTATAIAESIRDTGKNVLLLIDSVTRFAMAQRELSLAAGEPPTTRGYTPSVFAALPRLVERAGRTETGSITAVYSVLVEGDDTNEPIADTMRGLLDGHIVLSRALGSESYWPAIDVLQSLSRLQPHLVNTQVRSAADQLRRLLSEYQRNADLISIGAYRPGNNLMLDRAVAIREQARQLLTQQSHERIEMAQTHAALMSLVASANVSAG